MFIYKKRKDTYLPLMSKKLPMPHEQIKFPSVPELHRKIQNMRKYSSNIVLTKDL